MAAEELSYRGYKLVLQPHGDGWRVFIYAPGATLGHPSIPNTQDKAGRETVIAEAKKVVDEELAEASDP